MLLGDDDASDDAEKLRERSKDPHESRLSIYALGDRCSGKPSECHALPTYIGLILLISTDIFQVPVYLLKRL